MRVDEQIIGQAQPARTTRVVSLARLARLRRAALSPQFSFVDVPTERADAVLVLGSGRSGTTWVAELVNFQNEFRTIWEPFNTVYSPLASSVGFRWAEYRHPREADPQLEGQLRHLLEGRARSRWLDAHNTRRLPRRRLVKSIEMTNLAAWIRLRFPEVPVVYLVRHPFAFAESHVGLGWPSIRQIDAEVDQSAAGVVARLDAATRRRIGKLRTTSDPFERLVRRWCIENVLALHRRPPDVHLVHYESLVLETQAELHRLGDHVSVAFDERALTRASEPSRTDFRGRACDRRRQAASPESFVADWRSAVSPARRASGLRVLDAFGLLDVYDDDPLPRGFDESMARPAR
jgi:hypothetical protein